MEDTNTIQQDLSPPCLSLPQVEKQDNGRPALKMCAQSILLDIHESYVTPSFPKVFTHNGQSHQCPAIVLRFQDYRETQKAYRVQESQPEFPCFHLRALSSLLTVDRC